MIVLHRITAWRAGRVLLGIGVGASLAACAVGPDYQRPSAPTVQDYTAAPLSQITAAAPGPGGNPQQFVRDMDIPGQWWTLFHSAPLNALIDDALKHNADAEAAQACQEESAKVVGESFDVNENDVRDQNRPDN